MLVSSNVKWTKDKRWDEMTLEHNMRKDASMTVAKCVHMTCLCVSTFLSLCSYLFPNPFLHGSFPLLSRSLAACSSLSLSPFLCRHVSIRHLSLCHSVTSSGQASVSIWASDIKPDRSGERRLRPSKRGNTQGPPRLTSTNWLATPPCLILLRFSHQCPLPLPYNVTGRIMAPVKVLENYQAQKRRHVHSGFLMSFTVVCA